MKESIKDKKARITELQKQKKYSTSTIDKINKENKKIDNEQIKVSHEIRKLELLKNKIQLYEKYKNKEKLIAMLITILIPLSVGLITGTLVFGLTIKLEACKSFK